MYIASGWSVMASRPGYQALVHLGGYIYRASAAGLVHSNSRGAADVAPRNTVFFKARVSFLWFAVAQAVPLRELDLLPHTSTATAVQIVKVPA